MTRDEFMDLVYSELHSDGDNNRANRIIDAADSYAEDCESPEIIRCGDCKHKGTKNCVANAWTTIFGVTVKDDFYCGLAERRTDE